MIDFDMNVDEILIFEEIEDFPHVWVKNTKVVNFSRVHPEHNFH